eukprot:gene6996-9070_t
MQHGVATVLSHHPSVVEELRQGRIPALWHEALPEVLQDKKRAKKEREWVKFGSRGWVQTAPFPPLETREEIPCNLVEQGGKRQEWRRMI